ncbi:OmpA family protein [Devosia sp. CN2-171]|uniref:OmpA family protein n=1 Tax=Devosia sp. CN2-171 TaxID=3400909 RepID=UPI003BF788E2
MQLKRLLITTTSLCMLSLMPLPAFSQDAGLTAAYNAYVEAQSGEDADAKAAAEAAFLAECQRVGAPDLQQCIAIATGAATVEAPAPAEEPAPPAEQPAPAEGPAPAPAEQPAPAPAEPAPAPAEPAAAQPAPAEPAPTEQAPAEPAPAEQPSAASDPALIAAYSAYVSASSGTDADAKTSAEAAFLAECNRLGIASLDECLALMGGAPATPTAPTDPAQPATDQSGQPLEQVPDQQTPDAPVAPVLDSAKDASGAGTEAPAPAAPAEATPPPASDTEAQAGPPPAATEVTATVEAPGEKVDQLPAIEQKPNAKDVRETDDNRLIITIGLNINLFTPYEDRDRIGRDNEVTYERLENGRYRQTVIRPDGTRVITVWNRYGEIIRRVKVLPDGTKIIIIFAQDDREDGGWRDPGDDLPPFYLPIPVNEYVLYSERADEDDIELFLSEPPLEKAARVYTVDEVKHSARLRDTIRRVEIGDLTFDTGSAQLGRDQVGSLSKVAAAMKKILDRNPGEVFLVEGHTDAVGADESNLVLSDERAETVANLLSEFYDIPPENLTTQGYGERYLKVETDGEERANRRATIRRITNLVAPSAS